MGPSTTRVLILDDDANLRKTLCDILIAKGFDCIPVAKGAVALERIRQVTIPVVLIDLRLEDMSGLSVLRTIKEHSPRTECIVLTGHASQTTAIEAVNLGAYAYFQKPVDVDQLLLTIRRVMEKWQAEEALEESRVRYQTFINATTDMAFLKDDQFRYVISNEANTRFLGKPLSEIIASTDFELMDEVVAQACHQSDKQALQDNGLVVAVERVGGRLYETHKFPVPLLEGKVGVGGYIRDITEKVAAEESLRASEERYRMLAENMTDMIWLMDMSLKVIYITPSVTRLRGFTLSELNTLPLDRQMTAESLKKIMSVPMTALSPEWLAYPELDQPINMELEFYRKDGTSFWSENIFSIIRNENGWPETILSSGRDISARKQAEQELRESESRFRGVIQQSVDGIVLADERGVVIEWNRGQERITGLSSKKVLGKTLWNVTYDLKVPEERSKENFHQIQTGMMEMMISGKSENSSRAIEHVILRPDGVMSTLQTIMFCIPTERGFITCSISRDVTEKKKFQEVLQRQVNELEVLYENGLSISRLLEPKEIAGRMIDILAQKLDWHHAVIRLYHPETDCIEIIALNKLDLEPGEVQNEINRLNELITRPGMGLSGWVIKYGKAIRRRDVRKDKRYIQTFENIRSGIYVPIMVGDRVIGSIAVESREENRFNEDDERLLNTLAAQSAIAFENANLFAETRRRVDQFAALYDVSREMGLQTELARLLKLIAERAAGLFVVPGSDIYLFMPDQKEVGIVSALNERDPSDTRLRIDEAVAARVAKTKKPLVIPDYRLWKYRSQNIEDAPIRSILAVPMLYGGQLVGVLAVYDIRKNTDVVESGRSFTEEDVRLLTMFASTAAGAVYNTRLLEQTRQRAEELCLSRENYRLLAEDLEQRVRERTGEIETARHRLELATETGGLGIWERNLENDQETWNEQMYALYGMVSNSSERNRISRDAGIHPADLAKLASYETSLLSGKNGSNIEYRVVWFDESIHYLQRQAVVIHRENGSPERVIGIDHDITTHKQAEETLRLANAEMGRALRIKDEFLANMSHELRTPLNAILGISESLEEQVAGPLNEKQLKYLRTVSESGKHLLNLINDILDLSKIEAGRLTLNIQPVAVDPLIQSSLRMVKELAQKKNLHMSFSVDSKVNAIRADERRMKQVLVNLLSNAVKFTPEHGRIGLDVSGDPEAGQVTLTVWDTGIGIEPKDISRLFQPFVQLDAGLDREQSGTGLGLALVAQIIRLHGGRVGVQSNRGKGSSFFAVIPWDPDRDDHAFSLASAEVPTAPLDPAARAQKGKILLVEDTESVILIVDDYLQTLGYQVIVARDGIHGVAETQSQHPDLILMDIQMPGMDGFEATRKIHNDPAIAAIPIIALTAMAMPGDRERCLKAGMQDYISKPVSLKELANLIQRHLQNTV
jgi:PAS domain S-box-containing protein